MKCIYCGCTESRVIDSRSSEDGEAIRRRRECERCGRRFTTYEKVDTVPLMVVKKDMRREPFDSEKLKNGVLQACGKRPIAIGDIEELVRRVEMRAYSGYDQEITSTQLGELVMEELKHLDDVAYIRFASVYRQFTDLPTFLTEMRKLMEEKEPNPNK